MPRDKRVVLGEGYPDLCHFDNAVCLHEVSWRTEHKPLKFKNVNMEIRYKFRELYT